VVYTAWPSSPSPTATLVVRGNLETAVAATRLRTEMAALDASIPVYRTKTMRAALDDVQWNGRVSGTLFNVLAGLAIALCAVGLYAVTTHAVNVRAHEIALRLALGARRGHVMAMVLRRVLFHLMLGFAAGLGCTLAWSRLFASGRADISVTDPTTLALVAAALAGLALLATLAPLRRALQVDPLTAMRG
jgi:putative ABC transport system permease protein